MRGGEWYLGNHGSLKILAQSQNLGSIFAESQSLVFISFGGSRIFSRVVSEDYAIDFFYDREDPNNRPSVDWLIMCRHLI